MIQEDCNWHNLSNYERIKMIKGNWLFLKYFKNQTEEECITAVRQSSNALQYVNNQTYKICLEAIKVNPLALSMVINKTSALCLEAVKMNPTALQYVPPQMQTIEICKEALVRDGMCLKFINNQTERLCYEALISSKGAAFNLIHNKTKFLCKEAMKIDGNLLIYVPDKSFDICMEAIKQNPFAIRYVEFDSLINKDIEILIYEAIKRNGNVIQCINKKYHTQKICIIAILTDKNNIKYIDYESFNISLIDFENKDGVTEGLITVNQENCYVIKTNIIKDSIKNIKLDDNVSSSMIAFENFISDFVEKIKKKTESKTESTTNNSSEYSNNAINLSNCCGTSNSNKDNNSSSTANSEVDNGTKTEIICKMISNTKYEIYEIVTNIKYSFYFYKSMEEHKKLLYTLELFKYTTGLIL